MTECNHLVGWVEGFDPYPVYQSDLPDRYFDPETDMAFDYCPECGVKLTPASEGLTDAD